MPIKTPTTNELKDTIFANINARLDSSASPLFPRAFLKVHAKVLAGVYIMLHRYINSNQQQGFVSTASAEPITLNGKVITPLNEWGALVRRPKSLAATNAVLTVLVTVETQTGTLPAQSQLIGANNNVIYLTQSAILLNAATVSVSVRAVSDPNGKKGAGVVGNLVAGDSLNFANPLANVAREATVTAQTTTGADAETKQHYRARVDRGFKVLPQGGALADYDEWARGVEGISAAFVYRGSPGQVDVYVESGTTLRGVPTAAQLIAVDDAIQFAGNGKATRRPAGAWVNVLPISTIGFTVYVIGLVTNTLAKTQSDITAAIKEHFVDAAPFIAGIDTLPKTDLITIVELSSVVANITNASGDTFSATRMTKFGGDGALLNIFSLGKGVKVHVNDVIYQ